mmetsp:Transcript_4713/g.11275  ORF Transcript_4713/g.11275 Transcript_4713/m.11275 type:complete len:89 (+) Transcript_4713:409-675(+)
MVIAPLLARVLCSLASLRFFTISGFIHCISERRVKRLFHQNQSYCLLPCGCRPQVRVLRYQQHIGMKYDLGRCLLDLGLAGFFDRRDS